VVGAIDQGQGAAAGAGCRAQGGGSPDHLNLLRPAITSPPHYRGEWDSDMAQQGGGASTQQPVSALVRSTYLRLLQQTALTV
jgi:hypothetical protein